MRAHKAFGTRLKRGAVYVARLTNIEPPEVSRDDIDVTDHDSPDGFREFVPGLRDGGEMAIEGNLIAGNTSQQGLLSAIEVDTPETWVIEFPTTPMTTITFTGYVKSFQVGAAELDGALKFSASFKVTGKPVLAFAV